MKKVLLTILIVIISAFVLHNTYIQTVTAQELPNIILLEPVNPEQNELQIQQTAEGENLTTSIIQSYIAYIYPFATGLIAAIAVLMVVVGGLQITLAGGDSGKVTEGKERITYAIGGLVLLLLASIILYTINPNFFTFGG